MIKKTLLIIFIAFSLTGCNFSYFLPAKTSIIEFTLEGQKFKWISLGAESAGGMRYIQFSSKGKANTRKPNNVTIRLREPVKVKVYNKNSATVRFFGYDNDGASIELFSSHHQDSKIEINLLKWSDKPRGLIEGDIEAILYDFEGKEYKMKGHFKAYQALGTINSFH